MKKNLGLIFLAAILLFACGSQNTTSTNTQDAEVKEETVSNDVAFEEVRGVTIPKFSISINENIITNDDLAEYPIYKAQVTSTNSSGTTTTVNYAGFKFIDALDKLSLSKNPVYIEAIADDGYAVKYENLNIDKMMIAISKDGSQFKKSPWFCPCDSETTGDYLQNLTNILINDKNEKPNVNTLSNKSSSDNEEDKIELNKPDKQDKTDKVVFNDYKFNINNNEVTNKDLDGLKIYKITCDALNSKEAVISSTYTGYVLKDVLDKLDIKEYNKVTVIANDGYKSELTNEEINSEYTLIAIEKDKEVGKDGTIWVAPCESDKTKKYASNVIEINVE